jgi:hypothetical protein
MEMVWIIINWCNIGWRDFSNEGKHMKLIARYQSHLFDNKQRAELRLRVDNRLHCSWLDELEEDIDYTVEIKKAKSKRSLQQNKYLWELLHQLEKVSREPALDWYIKALVDTGAVVDYVWGTDDTEDTLKKSFRAVQKVKAHKIKETNGWLYRVIVGSSKFNVSEMNELIDTVIRYCNNWDIQVEEYRD